MSGLTGLGDVISSAFTGAPVDRPGKYAEGLLRSAQTESAISQARERRATAQAKERENNSINTLADDLIASGVDANTAGQIAAAGRSGLGNFNALTEGANNIAVGSRARQIADPTTSGAAMTHLRAAQAPGSYQQQRVEGGMLLDDATLDPTVTPVGQSTIDANTALAGQRNAAAAKGPAQKFQKGPGGVIYAVTGDPENPLRLATPLEEQAFNAQQVTGGIADAKTQAKLRADMPKARAAMRETTNDYKEVGELVGAAVNDPNLWQTTGLTQSLAKVPGTEGVRLRGLLNTVKYRLGFNVLQNMRQMSPTGGALGNVSNAEGEWLQNAIVPLNQDMSVGDLREVLGSLSQFMQNAQGRRQQAYNEQFAGIDPDIATLAPQPATPGALPPVRPEVAPPTPQPRVFKLPPVNSKGWKLYHDPTSDSYAYVGPNQEVEEVK